MNTSGLIRRRQLLRAAVVGAGLAMLPAARVLASAAGPSGPSVAMGYWDGQASAEDVLDATLVDARAIAPAPGSYRLRVLGANTRLPLALDAQYPNAATHRFWQAWSERGLLQQSPFSGIRWWAHDRKPLPLVVWLGGPGYTQVTARPGTYVIAIGPNAQPLPQWGDLSLQATGAEKLRLLLRSTGEPVTFPYLVFSVQPVVTA